MARILLLVLALGLPLATHQQFPQQFSFNPSPFFCGSVPQFSQCNQPAIPICCGPCYPGPVQANPVPAPAPSGAVVAPAPAGQGGAGSAVGPAPVATAAPAVPAPAPVATAAPAVPAPAGTAAPNAGAAPPTPAGGAGGAGAGGATAAPAGGVATATDNSNCPFGCPEGWSTWVPEIPGLLEDESCYLMPSQPLHSDTFWNQQAYCKSKDPTANILVINGLAEQALATAVSIQYFPSWAAQLSNIYWWLGGYTDTATKWHFVDGTDQSDSPLMIAANILTVPTNDTCIGAEAKTLGVWQTYSCEEKTGAVICEMPKKRVCGPQGLKIPLSPLKLSIEKIKDLFPKAPAIPFLSNIFSGKK